MILWKFIATPLGGLGQFRSTATTKQTSYEINTHLRRGKFQVMTEICRKMKLRCANEPPAEIIVTPEARYRYYSGVKFDERFSSMLSSGNRGAAKIAGQEGTRIAVQEGTRLAGLSTFFTSLRLFKNVESRWNISGFTKKPD